MPTVWIPIPARRFFCRACGWSTIRPQPPVGDAMSRAEIYTRTITMCSGCNGRDIGAEDLGPVESALTRFDLLAQAKWLLAATTAEKAAQGGCHDR
jgi:hypothetical protein